MKPIKAMNIFKSYKNFDFQKMRGKKCYIGLLDMMGFKDKIKNSPLKEVITEYIVLTSMLKEFSLKQIYSAYPLKRSADQAYTGSPILNLVTSLPTPSIFPATSCPKTLIRVGLKRPI